MNLAFLGATSDFDVGAIHVHLAIPDLVEPGPCKRVCTRFNPFRDLVRITFTCFGVSVGGLVALGASGWASSFDRVNDHPLGIFLCGIIGGQCNLT